jgi:hypothetical protein
MGSSRGHEHSLQVQGADDVSITGSPRPAAPGDETPPLTPKPISLEARQMRARIESLSIRMMPRAAKFDRRPAYSAAVRDR